MTIPRARIVSCPVGSPPWAQQMANDYNAALRETVAAVNKEIADRDAVIAALEVRITALEPAPAP